MRGFKSHSESERVCKCCRSFSVLSVSIPFQFLKCMLLFTYWLMCQSILSANISLGKPTGTYFNIVKISTFWAGKLCKNKPPLAKKPHPWGKFFYRFSVFAILLNKKRLQAVLTNISESDDRKVESEGLFHSHEYMFNVKQRQIQDKTPEADKSLRYTLQNFHGQVNQFIVLQRQMDDWPMRLCLIGH